MVFHDDDDDDGGDEDEGDEVILQLALTFDLVALTQEGSPTVLV